jgi:hypothetical protein
MSEPYWVALGSKIPIDYIGGWAAEVTYKPGDVVIHNGIHYVAANPSTGAVPPAVTPPVVGIGNTLPLNPYDGQEYILVDSLTLPTYQWRFRYFAAKATNKWLFVGGSPMNNLIATEEVTPASDGYQNLTTLGPQLTVPVAGRYIIIIGAFISHTVDNAHAFMSYSVGAVVANDAWAIGGRLAASSVEGASMDREFFHDIAAGTLVQAKYRRHNGVGQGRFKQRTMEILPVAVGG